LLTIMLIIVSFKENSIVKAASIIVPDQYSTIQEAVNAANEGDSIFVRNGVYFEHVIVNKSVSLTGEDAAATIIDGNGTGHVLHIFSDNVNVNGFTVQNSGSLQVPQLDAGICLNGTIGCTVSGNRLLNNSFAAISLIESNQNMITLNNLTSTGWAAVHMMSSSRNVVSGNLATDKYGGVNGHVTSNYNNVTENIITNCSYGMFYHASSYNRICRNNITATSVNGIWLQDLVNYNLIADNNLVNNTLAIRMQGPNYNNTVSGNFITGARYGIMLETMARYARITGNTITSNHAGNDSWSAGIRLDNGWDAQIDSNLITDNKYGVLLYTSSPRASICNNTIADNEFGLRVSSGGSNYVSISDNRIMNNTSYGIGLTGFGGTSDYATVARNLIANNSDGIALGRYSNYHQIFRNNLTQNNVGVYIEYSTQNTIWGNNIVDNAQQVFFSTSSTNSWNSTYPTGGNYWSNYAGTDTRSGANQNEPGSDEIGDTPHALDGSNTDRYPLIRPWIPFENQTITISTDGHVDPSGAPTTRKGDLYKLTANIDSDADGLVIEKDNTILDGAGFELRGNQSVRTGISLAGRTNVTIKNLNIIGFNCGILLDSFSFNVFYHNNFMNNSVQVDNMTPEYANLWDNGCEGNYWNDYTARYPEAKQINNTGIWDTPYAIDENNVDRFPLMNLYWNPCDINHDLKVDRTDIGTAVKAFGTVSGDPLWNPHADITGMPGVPDGKVDMRDIGLIARSFGMTHT